MSALSKQFELTYQNVLNLNNKIKLSDKDCNGLELFCYNNCNDSDNELVKRCRGVVFNSNEVVMESFPYTYEYNVYNDYEMISKKFENIENFSFFDSYEGTLIRMFYFKNKWYMTTHRKLDALKSKWSSKTSFGEYFCKFLEEHYKEDENFKKLVPEGKDSILERFQSTLNKSYKYMFLILPDSENRIVCLSPESPTCFHVGTFIENNLVLDHDVGIRRPSRITFNNSKHLIDYVNNVDSNNCQGVICFSSDNKQYKIFNGIYKELYDVRGNEPSIKFRYLKVRKNNRSVDMLLHLYPNMEETFKEIEHNIDDLTRFIYEKYVERYIKKMFVIVSPDKYKIIKECHKWHMEDRSKHRVNIDKVYSIINEQSPSVINHLIKNMDSKISEEILLKHQQNHEKKLKKQEENQNY